MLDTYVCNPTNPAPVFEQKNVYKLQNKHPNNSFVQQKGTHAKKRCPPPPPPKKKETKKTKKNKK